MILTFTINPSIDKTVTVSKVSFEEIIRTSSSVNFVGGKGINISRAIKTLGGETIASGFLGGFTGEWIKKQLCEYEKIPNDFVNITGETRVNLTILDMHSKGEIHLVEAGPSITDRELEELFKKVKKLVRKAKFIVFSGSIPQNVPTDIYARLIKIAKKENSSTITVLDTSGEPLRYGFEEKPSIVKPNAQETAYLIGERIDSLKKASSALVFFSQKSIEFPIISLGRKGVIALYQGTIYEVIPPQITPVSTVGSGDSLLAGILFSLEEGKDIQEALRVGVSCGIANALKEGAGVLKKSDIRKFYRMIRVKKTK